MNPLQSRLAAMRRRLRFVATMRGLCLVAAVLLAGLLLGGAVDALVYRLLGVETWPLLRAGFLAVTLTALGAVAYTFLLRPLAARTDDLSLALRVEEQYPILNDSLASTVQFLENANEQRPVASATLQQEAVQRALRLAQGCDFNKAVNPRGLSLSALALTVAAAIFVPLLLLLPSVAWTALARVTDPFGEHPWIGRTVIDVHCPAFLAIGQPLSIAGEVRGTVPPRAEVEFDDASMPPRQIDIKQVTTTKGSFLAGGIKLPTYRSEIRFRVRAGSGVSPKQAGAWHTVALRRPPQLVALDGKPSPQIVIRQPRYTQLPELVVLPEGTGNLDVVAGSHVTLRAATDVPIEHAWIDFKPLLPGAREALLLAGLGPRQPLDAVTTNELADSVLRRTPAVIREGGQEFSVHFVPSLTGAYVLTIQDSNGLSKSYDFDINVKADPVPVVSLLRPSTSQSVLADAEITLQILATDEIYGLRTVFLEYRRKDKQGQWVESQPRRLSFYDHAKIAFGLPLALNALTGTALPLPMELLQVRPKRLAMTQRWSLRGLAVEGETLVIQACAEDFNNVVAFPQAGRSHEIELKMVAKTALAGVLDEHEVEIHQQLLKLKTMQERALKNVVGAEEQWKAAGKLRPEDLVELAEAEQIQKDIQARIGANKDEGLRGEMAQIEEMLKDNKVPKSEVTERIRAIKEELERISRENLPKIEPGLTKARRELETPDQAKLPDPKEPSDLGDARAEQDKVLKSLEDLLRYTAERTTLQQLKGELRAILQEQSDRQKEVGKLKAEVVKRGEAVLRTKDLKASLRTTAELQRRLAERAKDLIDRLDKQGKKLEDTDPSLAEMLERAAKIGQEETVAEAMLEVAKMLKDNFDRPNLPGGKKQAKKKVDDVMPAVDPAHRSQANVIEHLQKMLEALDRTRADEVERIIVQQKKAENQLSGLAEKVARIQEEIEAAQKIADPQVKAALLKNLSEQLRALQKEAEQTARDIGRAEANEAANDLKDAVKKMERILRQLERGEEPEEPLNQAQEKIDGANAKLQEARAMAEQELAREKMAKIADRLKGLKERQDAVLAESDRLRKDFLQSSKWTQSKFESLLELKGAQDAVADETGFLKDKLKGAKVFHAMLDRSHQDMTEATKKLEAWQTKAFQHRAPKTLDDKDFTDEKALFELTAKFQKSAGDRLQRLLDALLPELEAANQNPKQPEPKSGEAKPGENVPEKKGGIEAQDGIPAIAQLKALKAEQLEVNVRTKEFAEQHPNVDKLTRPQREELQAIQAEQDRMLQLFRELMTAAKLEGEKR